ncbi:hypothetical protein [Desulfurivibrio alkaliphilus]|uniref:Uncharacterized protein n=1 Tax=Desulfurivibrio alkaliphilus (strain DSM 19089 / UNIQEM U267 / AHT2) TaxID=589865 RepID=D6Z3R8_DESAT|nr:hypothetical protein [Desulfurivibrio alkaliphilus]ADH86193.1 hypothetical protein DaAHT2_1498 [Desulfurivibrio alkaliphilus AHT 2]
MSQEFDIEKIIQDLKKIMPFKDTTQESDIVLIIADQLFYAVVTDIARDDSRRDEWWHVTFQLLTIPPRQVIWTLREEQFTGQEIFTMGGEKRYIKAISWRPEDGTPAATEPAATAAKPGKSSRRRKSHLKVIK